MPLAPADSVVSLHAVRWSECVGWHLRGRMVVTEERVEVSFVGPPIQHRSFACHVIGWRA